MQPQPTLSRQCLAELLGTGILVFFGLGAVNTAVLTGAQSGIWPVAIVWGMAVALVIYAVGGISGAHINPAITLALAAFGYFPWRKTAAYIASQLAGAMVASGILLALFSGTMRQFEKTNGLVRAGPGSELSAMVFGEYFPNPAIARQLKWSDDAVSTGQAMLVEALGTAFIAFVVLALTDRANRSAVGANLHPIFIGLSVAIAISVAAPLSQAGFNPARDFGPRLVSYLAGWGSVAIPGPRGGFFTVYILSPIAGALVGAGVWRWLIRPGLIEHVVPAPVRSAGFSPSSMANRLKPALRTGAGTIEAEL